MLCNLMLTLISVELESGHHSIKDSYRPSRSGFLTVLTNTLTICVKCHFKQDRMD